MIMKRPWALARMVIGVSFSMNREPGDIKEVESHTVYDHGKDQEGQTGAGVTDGEEAEAEDPGEDADEHDAFDTKTTEEKGDGEYKEGFGYLGDGGQQVGMFDGEGSGVVFCLGKIVKKGQSESVGDLEGGAEEHGKQEKDGHLAFFEQDEGVESEGGGEASLIGVGDGCTAGHGESIQPQYQGSAGTDI